MVSEAKTFPGEWRKASTGYRYFLPASLFLSQNLALPVGLLGQLEKTGIALGRFSSLIDRLPNPQHFIYAYTCHEATLSSRIEGTQTQIQDAFMEQEDVALERRDDWSEVQAYIRALQQATAQHRDLSLSNRLIKQTHATLLDQVRGRHKSPGSFRKSQNWIGGSNPNNAHFVPPATEHVADLMSDLEKFIHDDQSRMPHLIKAALIHYQFETIHPFSDGNGRIGRMLISLYLLEKEVLRHPVLYVSQFFEQHRRNYYDALDRGRQSEEGAILWISFFLDAVRQTADNGIAAVSYTHLTLPTILLV